MKVLKWLLSFVYELKGMMMGAIFLGTLSYLAVISIPILGTYALLTLISGNTISLTPFITVMLICGIARGALRYGEQYLNHAIAFRLLAIVRDRVYGVLRKLAPAKLQGKKSGDLIALITSDVEALEVFFAHTVSPVAIAVVVSSIMTVGISLLDIRLGLIALLGYLVVGVLIPVIQYRQSSQTGQTYKEYFAQLNQTVIEELGAVGEEKLYNLADNFLERLQQSGVKVNQQNDKIIQQRLRIQNLGQITIFFFSLAMLLVSYLLGLPFETITLATIAMMSSFGPVIALSGLGNALLTTFASAKRIYQLVDEDPVAPEIINGIAITYQGIHADNISFQYPNSAEEVIHDLDLEIGDKGILGIGGPSGIGKSTLLKLLMRFWKTTKGTIYYGKESIEKINTGSLHNQQGYMEQSTFLFEASVAENISLGKEVSEEKILAAVEKASLTDWLHNLPEGLNTIIGGRKRQLSEGEKQRIALARIFLYDPPLMLLDEPTSNLDYLNEKIILNSLVKEKDEKMIVLVSHRDTTLAIAEKVVQFKEINQKEA